MWISTIFMFIFIQQGITQSWNYQDFDAWGAVSEVCTAGFNQSPLDLRAEVLGSKDGRPNLQFLNYNSAPRQVTVQNNGHTVQLTGIWSGATPSIIGPWVLSNNLYRFNNFHLHWSIDDNNGTEHSIRQQKYAVELHLVHYNSKYRNFSVAAENQDGLAVIGILFQVNDSVVPNIGLQQFVSDIQAITNPGNVTTLASFNLSSFLPKSIGSLYSYAGSLTTPPCSENVRWIILSEPQHATSEIVNRLRNFNLGHGDIGNIRPLQEQNNRLIEFYK